MNFIKGKKIYEHLLVILAYVVLTLVFTFPLISVISNHLASTPYLLPGSLKDEIKAPFFLITNPAIQAACDADSILAVWVIKWGASQILKDPLNLFNANIFFPFRGTFAFGDHQIANCLFSVPLFMVTNNPVLVTNLLFLISFVIAAFGMYLLVFYYTGNRFAAFCSGLIFAYNPYRFSHLEHVMFVPLWMPFVILYLDKLLTKPNYKILLVFSIFFILQMLSTWTCGLFTLALVIFYTAFFYIIKRNLFTWPLIKKLCFSAILVLIFTAPFILSYMSFCNGSNLDNSKMSACVLDYITPAPSNKLYVFLLSFARKLASHIDYQSLPYDLAEHCLFLGFLPFVLLTITMSGHRNSSKREHVRKFFIILLFVSFILSLGTDLHFFKFSLSLPYKFLYTFLPLFGSLRPIRFFLLFLFSMSVLAGFGIFYMMNYLKSYRRNKNIFYKAAYFLIPAIIILEYRCFPINLNQIETNKNLPGVYRWLSQQDGDFAIVEFPTFWKTINYPSENWQEKYPQLKGWGYKYYFDAKYTYFSCYHKKKIVNGYNGYPHPDYIQMNFILESFPSGEAIDLLRSLGVKYLVIHPQFYLKEDGFKMINAITSLKDPNIKFIKRIDDDYILEVLNAKNNFAGISLWTLEKILIKISPNINFYNSYILDNCIYFTAFTKNKLRTYFDNKFYAPKNIFVKEQSDNISTINVNIMGNDLTIASSNDSKKSGILTYDINADCKLRGLFVCYQGATSTDQDFINVFVSVDGKPYVLAAILNGYNINNTYAWRIVYVPNLEKIETVSIKFEIKPSGNANAFLTSVAFVADRKD